MKRRLTYLIAFLVVLAVVIGPAVYMQKVFGSDRQNRAASMVDTASGTQNNASGQAQPAPTANQGETPAARQEPTQAGDLQKDAAAAPAQVAPAAAPAPQDGCPVWIAVVGKNGEQLYKAGQVFMKKDNKWGITALGALEDTGISYVTSPAWPDFVYSISGQANSGVSGWMYSVNGDVPMHMADKHPVKAGDRVIWWYSNSMEQPQPRWDDLIK